MKRYMAFMGYHYYPEGGIIDLIGFYDSIEECINAFHDKIKSDEDYENIIPQISEEEFLKDQWYNRFAQVYDLQHKVIAWIK